MSYCLSAELLVNVVGWVVISFLHTFCSKILWFVINFLCFNATYYFMF